MDFLLKLSDQAVKEEPELVEYVKALQQLADRMSMSHFKYGNMKNKYPESAKAIDNFERRLDVYRKTGNTEGCLDAANFLIIEHLFPSHKKAHFKALAPTGKRGLIWRED